MKHLMGLLAITAILFSTPNTFGQEQAQAPVYKEGDYWQFRLGKRPIEATIKDGKLKFFDPKPDQRAEIPGEKFPGLKNMLAIEQEGNQFLQFPLFVGRQWNVSEDTGRSRQFRTTVEIMRNVHSRVTGFEEVTTPAGAFKAFKIETTAAEGKRQLFSRTIFYSPETRSVVKFRLEGANGNITEIELLKFGTRN
jgi:hypothetical protein